MFSPTRTALCVAICAAMGFAATEASAGCKLINGAKVCASWITGSEICQVGVDTNQVTLGSNPTATCFVHGVGGDGGEGFFCDDSLLTGTQTCEGSSSDALTLAAANPSTNGNGKAWAGTNPARQGPKCNHDKFDPKKNPTCRSGTPDLGGGTLESPPITLNCDKNGICTGTGEVDVPDGATCDNGQDLVDFTADQFIGVVSFDGPEGSTQLFQLCTLDSNGHSYTCTDISDNVDEVSCGFGSP